MPAIELCEFKPRGGTACGKPASLAYRWEWGETGICCTECAPLLQQTAQNLARTVSIAPRHAPAEAPLVRSERTKLIAEKLSAEAELEEIKGRGADLYKSNVDLTRQVQTLTLQRRELEAEISDAKRSLERLETALQESESVRAELVLELERMRVLAPFTPAPAAEKTGKKAPPP